MSDVEGDAAVSAISAQDGQVANVTSSAQESDVTGPPQSNPQGSLKPAGDSGNGIASSVEGGPGMDGDSEAETLIESPEKKRNIVEDAPRLRPTHAASVKAESPPHDQSVAAHDGGMRKRKRPDEDTQIDRRSRSSSRRSSPLSSPVLNAASSDSDSDLSVRRPSKKPDPTRIGRRNGFDRSASQETDGTPGNAATQLKVRKRRPSDLLPHSAKHHSKHQDKSIDNSALIERRETRSATYPRQSSGERSLSPHPTSRREHRRGTSSQLPSLALDRKRRVPPPQIITRRHISVDRQSLSSRDTSSPEPSRPHLQKFPSGDYDTISPAKMTGIRKWKDKNGRTYLARACNNEDLEGARARLADRPEDLNSADNAGNTPLQIAALEGFKDIVKFLLENDCEIDTRNIDKDTPLIDAVENGHLEVVELLLEYGADPRFANAKGDEPYDIVPKEHENYGPIRKLLAEARTSGSKRRKSDDRFEPGNKEGSSRAASAASARDSPPLMGPRSPPAAGSRRRTGRSESTQNHLLWQAHTQENLTKLAAKGDVQGVTSILNTLGRAETEPVIAAAKAGHEEVLQYLLAMGNPDPDPSPIRSVTLMPGHNTPILAAIGRGNADVIKLLVSQSGFDPTREYKGRKYYEIAEDRKGTNWETEYEILKNANDRYATAKPRKHSSPRKSRDLEKNKQRLSRDSLSPVAIKQRPQTRSPLLSHKGLPEQSARIPRDVKRDGSGSSLPNSKLNGQNSRRSASDRSTGVASDQDQTIEYTRKTHKVRRSQSDLPPPSGLESETFHKRRRLVTGKEHRRTTSSAVQIAGQVDVESSLQPSKQERLEQPLLKRSRKSLTPDPTQSDPEGEAKRNMFKKRRTVPDSSPEEARVISDKKPMVRSSLESGQTIEVKIQHASDEQGLLSDTDELFNEHIRRTSSHSSTPHSHADEAIDAENVGPSSVDNVPEEPLPDPVKPTTPVAAIFAPPPHEDRVVEESVERKAARQADEENTRAAEEEATKRANEEAAIAERKQAEEAELKRRVEEAEAKKRAEEEAIVRKKEEEDRQEQAKRDMEERRRRQEEQKRQEFLESEKRRREALPIALCECARMLDQGDPFVRSHSWLRRFLPLYTVKTAQIEEHCSPEVQDDEWIANFQVAGLLATKDLNLRQYTSLDRKGVSSLERAALWRVGRLVLCSEPGANAFNTPTAHFIDLEHENKPKFEAMEELFWVKFSDFQDQVARHAHLSGLRLRRVPMSVKPLAHFGPLQPSPPAHAKQKPVVLTNGTSPYMPTALQSHQEAH